MKFRPNILTYLIWPLILFLALRLIWGFEGLYGQDSYAYLQYAQELAAWQVPSFLFWPPFYPSLGALGIFLGINGAFFLQAISLISLIGVFFSCRYIIHHFYPTESFLLPLYLFLSLLLSPYLLRGSMTVASDVCATWMILLAVRAWIVYQNTARAKQLLLFGLYVALATLTRFISPLVILPFAISLAWHVWKNRQLPHLIGALLVTLGIVLPVIGLLNLEERMFAHNVFSEWSFAHFFQTSFEASDGLKSYRWPNLVYIGFNFFHPGFFFPGGILLLVLIGKRLVKNRALPVVFSLLLYALFIGGLPLQNSRFLVLTYPLVIILYYPAFMLISTFLKDNKLKMIILALCVFIQMGLLFRAFKPVVTYHIVEKELTQTLRDRPEKEVLTFFVTEAARYYCPEKTVYNLFYRNIPIQEGQLCLFNAEQFTSKRENTQLFVNWQYIQEHFQLDTLYLRPDGWALFKLHAIASEK